MRVPGKAIEFSVSGTGSFPREDQNAQGNAGDNGGQEAGGQSAGGTGNQPGGGIGAPINTPDPLSKYKWWILGGLALLLAAAAAFLLRKPATAGAVAPAGAGSDGCLPRLYARRLRRRAKNAALLNALKEELFALESEKIAGTLAPDEYAEQKAALETVLKRALKRTVISVSVVSDQCDRAGRAGSDSLRALTLDTPHCSLVSFLDEDSASHAAFSRSHRLARARRSFSPSLPPSPSIPCGPTRIPPARSWASCCASCTAWGWWREWWRWRCWRWLRHGASTSRAQCWRPWFCWC